MKKNFNNATEALNFAQKMRKVIENAAPRSAWDKGVQAYALELLDNYDEYIRYAANDGEAVPELSEVTLLNGADSWSQYSWGGCSLIYNSDIAERLCSPSDLKRFKGGERNPNSREEWLDVQARALRQAFTSLSLTANNISHYGQNVVYANAANK
ncbi:hypothetical protein [Muribaculum intestinale]|uniref:hypothetical protein n=1 Tax=Muribaculum intestinale TaxID=1796646 RepID=UPI0025B696F9|nr:hypothetical protein [Muribaculum intestinale]